MVLPKAMANCLFEKQRMTLELATQSLLSICRRLNLEALRRFVPMFLTQF